MFYGCRVVNIALFTSFSGEKKNTIYYFKLQAAWCKMHICSISLSYFFNVWTCTVKYYKVALGFSDERMLFCCLDTFYISSRFAFYRDVIQIYAVFQCFACKLYLILSKSALQHCKPALCWRLFCRQSHTYKVMHF